MRRLSALALVLFAPSFAWATCPKADAVALANGADAVMSVNIDDAIARLSRATKLDPESGRIFYDLARAYVKKEQWKDAASAASTAATLAPTYASYYTVAGHALARGQAWTEAKVSLENAVRLDPNDADAHYDLASTLEHLHDEQGALDHYTRAIRAAPSRTELYMALADLYRRLGYLDQALAVVREGSTWSPSPHVHFTFATLAGAIAEEKQAKPEALARYREAKDACGACDQHGEAVAYFNLGAALATSKPPKKGEAEASLITFQKMICKGAAASRYANECIEAQTLLRQVTSP